MLSGEQCQKCNVSFPWEKLTGMPNGYSLCPQCLNQVNEAKKRKYHCPADGLEMKQEVIEGFVVLNQCPRCNGAFVDKEQLKMLKQVIRQQFEAEQFAAILPMFTV